MNATTATFGRIGLGLLGVAATAGVVHIVGSEGVTRVLVVAAPWLPAVLLVEGARIALESLATRALYGRAGRAIPSAVLARAHLIGYAVTTALPAGRAMGEAYKATALSPYATPALAAAVGTANQALALVASGVVAIPCAIAAYERTGFSVLTVAIAIHTAVVGTMGLAIQVASRSERLAAIARRISPKLAGSMKRYRDACTEHRLVPTRPLALHVAARGLQVLGLGLLLAAVTLRPGVVDALVGQAITFVGTSAGDLVPFQLGATDSGWALAGPLVGLTAADAVGVALLAHAVQIVWSAIGALVPLGFRPEERAAPSSAR